MSSSILLFIFLSGIALSYGNVLENPLRYQSDANINDIMENAALGFNSKSIFSSGFPDQVQKYIDCLMLDFRSTLRNLGVEMDPYKMAVDQTNFDLGILKGIVQLNEVELQGLSNVKVQQAKLTPQVMPVGAKLQLKIVWPNINMLSGYSSNVTFFGRPLNANGNSTGALNALAIDINAKITQSPLYPKVQYLSVKPTLGNSNFNLGGLGLNNVDLGERLSSVLNQLAQFVNINSDDFDQLVSPFLVSLLNERLSVRPTLSQKQQGISSSSACQFSFF